MPSKVVAEYGKRDPLEAVRSDFATRVPAVIALGFIMLVGDILGAISASGKLRRRTRAVVGGAGFAIDSATGVVDDVTVFKVGDVLKNAAGANVGTVQSINTGTNTITLTGNAAVAVAAGAAVLGSDGSQVARAISDDETDGTQDANASVLIGGFLKEAKLRGLDSTAKAELGGVSTVGGIFKF